MVHNPSDDELILESQELLQGFVDQLADDLTKFEANLISLSKGELGAEEVAETLRDLHSHKGSASALHYTIISSAIHQIEEQITQWQKSGKDIDLEHCLNKIDIARQAVDLAVDESLSRSEFVQKYEALREGMRSTSSQKRRILVIDSLQATTLLVKEEFEKAGLEVVVCKDAYIALGRVLHESFFGVLCGGVVVGLDGEALLAAIQINSKTKGVKTLLLTSNSLFKGPVEPDLIIQRTEKGIQDAAAWLLKLDANASQKAS